MKQLCRILGVFCLFFAILSINALAADAEIDVSTAPDGFFSVFCEGTAGTKMKVGVTTGGQTFYYDYTPGAKATFAFDKGDGDYTITLYRNLSGTRYQKVLGKSLSLKLKDPLAPYLASTTEITFAEGDDITCKAAELCQGLTDEKSKLVAIHNYIAGTFQYDDVFADTVRKGTVHNYTPDTNQALRDKLGVCYDFSAVFAAMCRSQGIPCALEKGYTTLGYHAWNQVWVDGAWATVDVTTAVVYRTQAAVFSDCIVSSLR